MRASSAVEDCLTSPADCSEWGERYGGAPIPMQLSVVVVNWNSREDLRACLSSLQAQSQSGLEVIVVDNGSTDGSADMVATEFPECRLIRKSENLGFAEGCNVGIDASTAPWIAMLNNDTVADPDWALALVEAAKKAPPACGMLQSLLLFKSRPDTINSTGIELTRSGGGRDRDWDKPRGHRAGADEIFCPTAGAAAYRKEMLDAVRIPEGYFDREHFMYYEDMDLGWRARLAGWTAQYVPSSIVYHQFHGSADRHGRVWLDVILQTNRLRTMLKNASPWFIVKTIPRSVREASWIVWHGGARRISRAVVQSIARRADVTRLAKLDRRALERTWASKG